jgi:ATP-dependent DNA ligase
LPDRGEGRWGDGLTAAKMAACRWLDLFLVARIEFLEWTPDNRLRHPPFAGIRSDKDARNVVREDSPQFDGLPPVSSGARFVGAIRRITFNKGDRK